LQSFSNIRNKVLVVLMSAGINRRYLSQRRAIIDKFTHFIRAFISRQGCIAAGPGGGGGAISRISSTYRKGIEGWGRPARGLNFKPIGA
jgi:hypothetical protein